jgi:glycogen(starch) synthase
VLSWWRAVRREHAPANWDRYRAAARYGIQAAQLVVAPSQAMLSSLREHYGPLPPSEVIPNGRTLPKQDCVKGRFVLAAGRIWDEAKNLSALTAVASDLAWPVFLAGDAKAPAESTSEIGRRRQREQRLDNVHWLGRLAPAELLRWFSRAAIYALPARYEPFGLSALEAALASCALVLGDIPSLREIWQDAALFVPPDETKILKQTLQKLIADRAALAEWGRRARARALEFSPQRMAAGYLKAYSRLMSDSEDRAHALPQEKVLCES